MSARTVILGLVREALAAIRTQHAVTAVTVLLLAASSFTVVTTAGRAAASQAAVLSTIDARGTRTILVQAKGAVEGVDEQFLATLARVADVEAATGFGPVTDVTAAANPDGPRLGVRQAYGVIGGRLLTQPEPGPAGVLLWTSPAASRVVGLPPGAGSVRAVDGGEYLISRSLEVPDYLSGFEPLAVIPATPREPGAAPRPVSTVVVLTRSPESVGVVTTLITRLLREAPPDQLTIQTSEGLAALRKAVGGEITRSSRGLILGVLGAAALGVRNVLCLTGDDVSQGDHPEAKPVFDLDAVNLLHILRGMSERGEYASGRKLEQAPRLFLGATANPFVPPYADRVANLERKIDAGARFIQTQFCFDLGLIEDFMREVRARGLHERAAIIVGVGTLGSAKALRWMAEHVPGVHVPQAVTERIAAAADQKAEGRRVAIETIHALRRIEGVAGVHLMGHKNEAALAQIIAESGLRQAPQPAAVA